MKFKNRQVARRRVIYFDMQNVQRAKNEKPWFVYILKCSDGTYYTGATNDLTRRVAEHNHSATRGARYTRSRRPVKLIAHIIVNSQSAALKLEHKVKKQKRKNKISFLMEAIKNVEIN